ncbi:NACHT, LRR and PYD domains-containing protein 3-like isoform X2 [Pleurodeles waltl]|uniref:NACHT, LRR and PYD domains-containing protein 3-like isoform X2 n=1 Tax=Pleurodeles waltl TaxID=8319 RepID=UPI003709ABD1
MEASGGAQRGAPGAPCDSRATGSLLTRFSDLHLRRLTEHYRPRLEAAFEGLVHAVGFHLFAKKVITSHEYESIKDLAIKEEESAATEFLLDIVLGRDDAVVARAMWQGLEELQDNDAYIKIKRILQEIETKGDQMLLEIKWNPEESLPVDLMVLHRLHRKRLAELNANLTMSSLQGREPVKTFLLEESFTELIVIPSLRHQDQVEHELMARGRDHLEWRKQALRRELEKIKHHQIFGGSFGKICRCLRTVVSGVAGIGKTTLMQKIVYDWAVERIYRQFHFLFHFKFRELNAYEGSISLKQMILDAYPYLEKDVKRILQHSKKILFIFDGLDEFKDPVIFPDLQSQSPLAAGQKALCLCPESWRPISDIVRDLLQGELLPGCSVLVTTRPTALESLRHAHIDLYVEILGFSDVQIKDYFMKFYQDDRLAQEILSYVEQNAILYTMCYNPSYCWVICSSLKSVFTSHRHRSWAPPKTITQLYSNYIHNILTNHSREAENPQELLLRIGEMAYMGVTEKVIIFSDAHFHQYRLQPNNFLSGFLMEILQKEKSWKNVVYSFFHLTVQEFMAAFTKFLSTPTERIIELLNAAGAAKDGRYEIFLQFMSGLCCPEATAQLQDLIGEVPQATISKVLDWVKKRFEESQGHKLQLLSTLHYLFEAQNTSLVRDTIGRLRQIDFSFNVMTPVDCYVLASLLESCHRLENLHLFNCSMQAREIKILKGVLHKCVKVRLAQNRLGDQGVKLLSEALKKSDCQIQLLELWMANLTDGCIPELASALSTNQSLKHLLVRDNQFTDRCIPCFFQLLENCSTLEVLEKHL